MYDFTLIVLPGAFASAVSGTLDILACAASLARRVGCAAPRWRVCSSVASVPLSSGLRIEAQALPEAGEGDASVWLLPGLGMTDAEAIATRLAQADAVAVGRALRAHAAGGGSIAAACSSVFLLQEAGLLAGRRATTTWWLGGLLQSRAPDCRVEVAQVLVVDGELLTAGAAFAYVDLALHLLRCRFSPALAEAVSRVLLIDGRQSQARYVDPALLAGGNELVAGLVARFEAALPNPPSVSELAAERAMSSRTLARHVRKATGGSVSALLQGVRINRARLLLESTRLSVEQVAEQVGYADTSALRRLMRKVVRGTPSQFRQAVGQVHGGDGA